MYIYILYIAETKIICSTTTIFAQPEDLTKSLKKLCSYITSETSSDMRGRWWKIHLQETTGRNTHHFLCWRSGKAL